MNPSGTAASEAFKINDYTENDQREPAVAAGREGTALVVWSSFGQDGDRGGIFGRLVTQDPDTPFGQEFQISEVSAGHQQEAQVVGFAGGYWVAWETVDSGGRVTALSLRHVHRDGRPLGREMRIEASPGEQVRLLDLSDSTPGSVRIGWWRQDRDGNIIGQATQSGRPSGLVGRPDLGQ
jgi:hypothetical protein